MFLKYFLLLFLLEKITSEEELYLLKSVRTDYLQNYLGYSYVTIIHFNIPTDTKFASFRFQADQTRFSIFGCDEDEVILYMKHGSIPIINEDNAKNPTEFYNASYSKLMYLEFSSDKKYHYINISTPASGSYYATAFHPFVDPNSEAITQSGLKKDCSTYIDANLYIQKYYVVDMTSGVSINAAIDRNETQTYKFYVSDGSDRLILVLNSVKFCSGCNELNAILHSDSIQDKKSGLIKVYNNSYDSKPIYYHLWAQDNSWYYVEFNFFTNLQKSAELLSEPGVIEFEIKAFPSSNAAVNEDKYKRIFGTSNLTELFGAPKYKSLYNDQVARSMLYKEYDLVRSGKSESFLYGFDLHPSNDGSIPISVNLTSEDYTSLKFYLNEAIDTGGTINFILAFAPRLMRRGNVVIQTPEPSNHTVIACLRSNVLQMPTWPHNCNSGNNTYDAPIVLNQTTTNSTIMLPYPEAGQWYITLKLFCGDCQPCACPSKCLTKFKECISECEEECSPDECSLCSKKCEMSVLKGDACVRYCDCDGPCQKTDTTCNSSILFDISSSPCVSGTCGKNGRCIFMVTEGIVYSTCICSNKYKGWDCNDDSAATSYGLLVLEMCLLTISNIVFLPATYIAIRRKYYVESVVYFSTFLFSTLYHACDAGENVINFCMVKLSVLQFSDFFSGLLSIWVTLIAMAYLQQPFISLSHISGCILLAFGTTYNKTSIWVFTIPAVIGICIVTGNWIYLGKTNKCLFPRKRYLICYLPIGLAVVCVALLTFALFQTQSNYKYLHSIWHILMAVGVIILLPKTNTFLPDSFLTHIPLNRWNSGTSPPTDATPPLGESAPSTGQTKPQSRLSRLWKR